MTEEKTHAEFPPSQMELFYNCPGSWYISKGIPQKKSDDAEEGTMLHGVIAKKLIDPSFDISNLTLEQQDIINFCLNLSLSETEGFKIAVEQRVYIKDDADAVLTWGTADVVAINGSSAIVIDWKFGRAKVEESEDNMQKATYALGIMQDYQVDEVKSIIVQPRLHHVSRYTFTNKKVIYDTIESIINRCKDNTQVNCRIGIHCTYCNGKIRCPAFMRSQESIETLESKEVKFTDIELTELFKFNHLIAALTKKNMDWIKPEITRILNENSDKFMGIYKFKKSIRSIKDLKKAWELLGTDISKDDFLDCCDISVTKLEDTLRHKLDLTKEQTKLYIENKLGDNLNKEESETIKITKDK